MPNEYQADTSRVFLFFSFMLMNDQPSNLQGKVVPVTRTSKEIGEAMVRLFAQVVVRSRKQVALDELATHITRVEKQLVSKPI